MSLTLNALTTICFCVALLCSILHIRTLRKRAEDAERTIEQMSETTTDVEGRGDRE